MFMISQNCIAHLTTDKIFGEMLSTDFVYRSKVLNLLHQKKGKLKIRENTQKNDI